MKTAFFDVDHTLYDGYLGTDFTLFMVEQGYADASILKKEHQLLEDYTSGKVDYREAARWALQNHADCLKGKSVAQLEKIQADFAAAHSKLFPWVVEAMGSLHRRGFEVYLISAAPVTAIEAVADSIGVKNYFGTQLVIQDGIYTGELGVILNYEEKHRVIQELAVKNPEDLHVGAGDSIGDVDMLSAMDKAVLYEPKSQELIDLAKEKGWAVGTLETMKGIVDRF